MLVATYVMPILVKLGMGHANFKLLVEQLPEEVQISLLLRESMF
jgi:hypothetical protein